MFPGSLPVLYYLAFLLVLFTPASFSSLLSSFLSSFLSSSHHSFGFLSLSSYLFPLHFRASFLLHSPPLSISPSLHPLFHPLLSPLLHLLLHSLLSFLLISLILPLSSAYPFCPPPSPPPSPSIGPPPPHTLTPPASPPPSPAPFPLTSHPPSHSPSSGRVLCDAVYFPHNAVDLNSELANLYFSWTIIRVFVKREKQEKQ